MVTKRELLAILLLAALTRQQQAASVPAVAAGAPTVQSPDIARAGSTPSTRIRDRMPG